MQRHAAARASALCAAIAAAIPAARVEAEVVEKVVATVNEEAILLSELRRRALFIVQSIANIADESRRLAELRKAYDQMLDQLIDEELLEQAARELSIRVAPEEIDRAVQSMRAQNNLDEEQFWAAVQQEGFTRASYREDVRRQIVRLKVINQRVRSRVNITDDAIRRRYEQRLRAQNRRYRFRASHIFLPLSEEVSATEAAAVRRRAEQIRAQCNAGNFEELAARYGGGALGWLSQGDLPQELEGALLALAPGEVSEPIRGPQGYHLLLVLEREQGDGGESLRFDDVRDNIQREMEEEAMARLGKSFLQELRRKAAIDKRL